MITSEFKLSAAAAILGGLTAAFSPVSDAEAGGHRNGYHHHRPVAPPTYYRPPVRVAPPPVYYAPPPVYYAPPVRVVPPPVYYAPPAPYYNPYSSYNSDRRFYEQERRDSERRLFNELGIRPMPQQYYAPQNYGPQQHLYIGTPRGSLHITIR